jgi:HAD superfamily hydrolase (TIGR01549 family)
MPKTIKAVIFDLDGTITRPILDFIKIKQEIGTDRGPLLEAMEGMKPKERRRAEKILERHEKAAAADSELNPGVPELFQFLKRHGIKTAILTRNSRRSTEMVLEKHGLKVDEIATREDARPKPSPEPLFHLSRRLKVTPQEMLMVGDFYFDVLCGKSAGALTAFFSQEPSTEAEPDFHIKDLKDLIPLIEQLNDE